MINTWQVKRNAFCSYPFQRLKVDSEGYCTFCCSHTRKCLGNLLELSLNELWNSKIAQDIRQETLNGKLHKTCAIESCPLYHLTNLPTYELNQCDFPTQLEIDLPNTHCNIGGTTPNKNTACLMCERSFANFLPQINRVKEICVKLKPLMKHLNMIHIQGIAEPFWKNMIFEILEDLDFDKYKKKIIISTTTNGTLLNEKIIKQWLTYPNSSITFSIDSSTPETFKKIRRLNIYQKVIDNLMIVSSLRKSNQKLRIHNNINMINVSEVVGMVEVAAKAKVDEINFNPTYNLGKLSVSQSNVSFFKDAEKQIVETAIKLNVNATFLRKLTLDFDENLIQIKV